MVNLKLKETKMIKSFMKIGVLIISAVMFTACGGGGGDTGGTSTPNKAPTADAGANIDIFGSHKATLDASGSSDVDGSIVTYTWTEGSTVLGTGETLSNLSFADGTHTVTLTVKDNDGATATDTLTVTAECTDAEPMSLVTDANGTVNYVGANEKSFSCYEINLTSNNGIETYMMYMNLYNGTHPNVVYVKTAIFNANGALHHTVDSQIHKEGHNYKSEFTITSTEKYYIRVSRANRAAKYGFSIQPSLENGLVQNSDRELNDNFAMAAPITQNEAMNDINGSLNASRTQNNSLKNTDDVDYYSMDLEAKTYSLDLRLYNYTHPNVVYVKVAIFDEYEALHHTFNSQIHKAGQQYISDFTIGSAGKYYIRVSRANRAAKYGFSIQPK